MVANNIIFEQRRYFLPFSFLRHLINAHIHRLHLSSFLFIVSVRIIALVSRKHSRPGPKCPMRNCLNNNSLRKGQIVYYKFLPTGYDVIGISPPGGAILNDGF